MPILQTYSNTVQQKVRALSSQQVLKENRILDQWMLQSADGFTEENKEVHAATEISEELRAIMEDGWR